MNDMALAAVDALVAITSQMLEKAKLDEWHELMELDIKRRSALEQLFCHPNNLNAEIIEALQQVLSINETVLDLCNAARQNIVDRIKLVDKGRVATSAYDTNKWNNP